MTVEQAELGNLGLGIATVCALAVSAITASLLPFALTCSGENLLAVKPVSVATQSRWKSGG